MKFLKHFPLLFIFLIPFFSFAQPTSFTHFDSLRGTLSPLRSCYDVTFYDLRLTIDLKKKEIKGSNQIQYKVKNEFTTFQVDLYAGLTILRVDYHGKSLKFERDSNATFIHFIEAQKVNSLDSITIYYYGIPEVTVNPPWTGGVVWSSDSLGRPWVGVACEGDGASLWWPCKDHPSDEPDSMRMNFSVPKDLICISNGNLKRTVKGPVFNSYLWAVQYPINIYNVTFNIGHYSHFSDTFTYKNGAILPLDYYVLDYNLEKAKIHFEKVKPMLACYEKLFGQYPFMEDGYALVETPYWGMEHQSAVAYGNHYHTDFLDFDYIIVHESAHEWWGNSLSAKDHAELWIHESFATYTEALLVECSYNHDYYLKYLDFQKQKIENVQPILGPLNVNFHYWKDSDMYYKGSLMLHTLRNSIGNDSLWFSIIYGLANHFKISTVNTEDIITYINQRTGKDYHSFFDQYLNHTEPPTLVYSIKNKGKHAYITYKWKAEAKGFYLPIFVIINKKDLLELNPSAEFQTYKFPKKVTDLRIPEEYFYIHVEKIQSK